MNPSNIKIGDILEIKVCTTTTAGLVRDIGLIIPGTRVKIIRKEERTHFKCEVHPVEKENGPVYVWLWASELTPKCTAQIALVEGKT